MRLTGESSAGQKIAPVLMFVGGVCGKTEETIEPDREGTVRFAQFSLLGQEFGAMDSAREPKFSFNEAISFLVPCQTQEQIDYFGLSR